MPRQVGAPRRGGADHVGDLGEVRPILDRVGEDFDGAGDHGQNVVEVVRHAAGELADRFHLLRLPDLGLVGLDLLKTFDHGLGLAPVFHFLLERRIGVRKLHACRQHQETRQHQQQCHRDPERYQRQQALDEALDVVSRHPHSEDRKQAGQRA